MDEAEQIAVRLAGKKQDIDKYLRTGEIGSYLSLDAALAMTHAEYGWRGIIPEYAAFSQKWIKVYARIATEVEDICFKAKEFELKHWMGFCDEDVQELLRLRREWDHFDWENEPEERCRFMRELWNPCPNSLDDKDYWRKHWQKYVDRRSRIPLQTSWDGYPSSDKTPSALHQLAAVAAGIDVLPKMKAMMAAAGGRVLLTLQDRYPQEDPRGIYGGAHVTLIFDQDAEWPRGGVQGHCATRNEAIALIQAAIDDMPVLRRDGAVRFF